MLRNFAAGGNFISWLIQLLVSIPAVIIAITFHEFAHGFVAYKLGDPSAKLSGRLNLNPASHFDLIGSLALLLFGFGWAKPVPFNPSYFKNQKRDTALVALAGPVANLALAFVAYLVAILFIKFFGRLSAVGTTSLVGNGFMSVIVGILLDMLFAVVSLNVGLMLFNLIPIPPLDGSKILISVLPYRAHNFVLNYERYGAIILIFVLFSGILDYPLGLAFNLIYGLFNNIGNFILSIF